jgi:uncharacterized membrane protein (UPF0182 family)
LVALLCLVTIGLRSWRPLLTGVAALAVLAVVGGAAYPGLIQRYQVSPNEIVKEKPYIDFNIRSRPLLATYSQLQEIRTHYKFTDIDIDRYTIDGEYRQVTLSPRELSAKGLPSRIWINERLTYTHGYGAVVSPVNRVTREGLPDFWIKDIPPATSTDLRISRPEIYFGEVATDHVFAKTRAKEFDSSPSLRARRTTWRRGWRPGATSPTTGSSSSTTSPSRNWCTDRGTEAPR